MAISKPLISLLLTAFVFPVFADEADRSDDVVHNVDSTAAETLARIDLACLQAGEAVVASDAQSVLCEIPLNRSMRIAARVMLRAPFAVSPQAFVRFVVNESKKGCSLVLAQGWIELNKPEGNRRLVILSGPRFIKEMNSFFNGL